MLKIDYKILKDSKIKIVRCYGKNGKVKIPDQCNGMAVTSIGEYAFSPYKKKEEADVLSETMGKEYFTEDQAELLCGNKISEITLPHDTEEIGRYAFYGCANLKKLRFSDSLLRTGAGIFTGCKLEEIYIDFYHGNHSCMKEIVSDTRHLLTATLYYHMENGIEEAKLVFPEYYEEAVENTPARIIENHFNGTGYKYRQCFFRDGIDFGKYDRLFEDATAQEKPHIVEKLLFGRLLYPYQLEKDAKNNYLSYIAENREKIIPSLVRQEHMRALELLSKEKIWTRSSLDDAVDQAVLEEKPEILSLLMNEKHRIFPKTRKTFEL